ncbi:3-(cis-5,6-dihydroxycyclohexa-1,3-dien-1-yl)propanoate dehydrogenase [Microtetraspora fusca]|uniref:3-(Cis-5,6-dihydroxycyclohexa-1, 3-dien-1-yl)propanoate dehydrogenase n=1 Tax=Microtetraspora fusca TaxID=1997 RepID=A0ABW6VB25_MICFU
MRALGSVRAGHGVQQPGHRVPHPTMTRPVGWLDGQVTLITGGGAGLGRAIAERFVTEGAHVAAFDRSATRLERLTAEVPEVLGIVGDVRSLGDNERAVQQVRQRFGRLDVVVANAGIWDFQASLDSLPADSVDDAFDEVFHTNVKGYLLAAKAAAPALRRRRGSLILTLSNASFHPDGGGPLYTASKHAAHGLLRQLAYELAPDIRVNAVAPGGMATELSGPTALGLDSASISTRAGEWQDVMARALPLSMVPTVDDMTSAYVLLASRAGAKAMTGAVIEADGGIGVRGVFHRAGSGNRPATSDL